MSFPKRLISTLGRNVMNIPGRKVKRKLIVFESDDWGSIRMPSRQAHDLLEQQNVDVRSNPYNRFDALESEEDLDLLFNLLSEFKDRHGNHPVITANFVMANPDFLKIRNAAFKQYHFHPFAETYQQYPNHNQSLLLIRQGMDHNLIYPQFHAREHLNVCQWLRLLQDNHHELHKAFDLETFGIEFQQPSMKRSNLMAAFDYDSAEELEFVLQSLEDGFRIFEKYFGFKSLSFIAPCHTWDDRVEEKMAALGVRYIQSVITQKRPVPGKEKYGRIYRFTGEQNRHGQMYLVRNCYFEPATLPQYDWINNCIHKIETAFNWHNPVIISTHRLNFIGSIFRDNRERNLRLFRTLLDIILKRWPDVEFVNSVQLGDIIRHKN